MARRGVLAVIVAFAAIGGAGTETIRPAAASDPNDDSTGGAGYGASRRQRNPTMRAAAPAPLRPDRRRRSPSGAWVAGRPRDAGADRLVGHRWWSSSRSPVERTGPVTSETGQTTSRRGEINIDGNTVTLFAAGDSSARRGHSIARSRPRPRPTRQTTYDETAVRSRWAAPPAARRADAAPTARAGPDPAPPTTRPRRRSRSRRRPAQVTLSGTPSTIKRNRTMTLKLKVANAGSKKSSKVTVSVRQGARAVRVEGEDARRWTRRRSARSRSRSS